MNNIREVFDNIKAEDSLKESTLRYVSIKTNGFSKKNRFLKSIITTFACLVLIVVVSGFAYLTPTMAITVDIGEGDMNSEIELGINRFDRVVSVKALDDVGASIVDSLNLKHKRCKAAVDELIQCPKAEELFQNGEVVSFNIQCDQTQQRERIQECIEECQGNRYGQNKGECQSSGIGHDNGKGNGYHGGKTE